MTEREKRNEIIVVRDCVDYDSIDEALEVELNLFDSVQDAVDYVTNQIDWYNKSNTRYHASVNRIYSKTFIDNVSIEEIFNFVDEAGLELPEDWDSRFGHTLNLGYIQEYVNESRRKLQTFLDVYGSNLDVMIHALAGFDIDWFSEIVYEV